MLQLNEQFGISLKLWLVTNDGRQELCRDGWPKRDLHNLHNKPYLTTSPVYDFSHRASGVVNFAALDDPNVPLKKRLQKEMYMHVSKIGNYATWVIMMVLVVAEVINAREVADFSLPVPRGRIWAIA